MENIECWLITESVGLLHGTYKNELVIRHNRLWVWYKSDSGTEWTLQNPNMIVVDEEL
ncbi:hypothetical protein SEA_STARBOW_156 [Streptomyces phage Starbow]|uniref:Uncharacterized protein n=2 Tax=Streptomyces virus Karimac TaxID=2846401 RepID=A0A890UUW8_9CAUD|nr:hypothetical protein [Streptomyces sp. JV178]AXH66641.1 hypothetical protein SEA_STARBOW_156 [Streptomyces phage Starbow]QGH74380.1 hypothetical protein SEA_WIPEOUT_152 [Streptomyces phage Wipeout]QGH79024.1 hypothetical protein SEA_TOMSAWYER_161 [Streptomyces phage TomSawyer]QRI45822.1 hypothetical protein SEA_BATTUTA_158 [Streptomyces phage Battuta]URM87664.1 hypothetical protein SEA_QUARAN19_159 [Streptomyces phage Quaran19]UVK60987.1 hypothetical protein SEA_JIMJAM_164 [Streptomyces ph